MTLDVELVVLEELFWLEGTADFYRAHLAGDAVMVFPEPYGIFDADAILASVGDEPAWDAVRMENVNVVRLRQTAAVIAYRAEARRASGEPYSTYAASVYVRADEGSWKLAFHQQTPISPSPKASR